MIVDDPSIIEPALQVLKKNFQSHKTKPISYRKEQLKNLLKGLKALEQEFHVALEKDLGVSQFGSQMTSTIITCVDVEHNLNHVSEWASPISVDTPFVIGPGHSKIVYEPLGVVLVIAAWNYPLYTAVPPLAAAIAAGNCAILKPSELAPHSSNVLKKLIDQYLDQECYRVIEGGVEVAIKITTLPFDLMIFTGSPEKGKLVARAASNNLVPCILELGGKSPTIVDEGANIGVTAQRIVQGRFMNAGQTCVACDYLLVHEKEIEKLTIALKKEIKDSFGDNAHQSQDFARIVTQQHTLRLQGLLENHGGQVVCGGEVNVNNRYVSPTLVLNPNVESKLMTEEIFGPILPIIGFQQLDQAIKFINDRPKPLALYYFGNNSKHKQLIERNTSSGAIVFNDAIFHLLNPNLPFGGVGNSGYSAYHGITGFKNCSHAKSIFDKSTLNVYPFNLRYPPFTQSKISTLALFFKFHELSQRAVQKGIILIAFLIGLRYSQKKGYLLEILKKSKPYIDQIYKKANL